VRWTAAILEIEKSQYQQPLDDWTDFDDQF